MLRLSKESQNNTIAVRQEIWVLLKMYAGSCQGNGFSAFHYSSMGAASLAAGFLFVRTFQACIQASVCVRACSFVCVCVLSVKREAYESKLS